MCRTAALRKRHAKQLQQFDRDQFGVPVPSTGRPFSIWASPMKIGEACAGLGIHFASVKAFVVVALLLSIVATYPLVNDLNTKEWDGAYRLVLGQASVAACPKPWPTHNWLTAWTVGGHCSSRNYNSGYECGATCRADPARLAQAQCSGQAWRGAVANATQTCALHLPCNSGIQDPAAPNGPCHCCDLALDEVAVDANPQVSAGQLWTFLLGQLEAMHKVDARVITASDYSVIITGINPSTTTDKVLQDWCRHYGPVAMACNIPNLGAALKVGEQVRQLKMRKSEAEAQLHQDCPPAPCLLRPWGWLYWGVVVGSRRRLVQQLEQAQHKLQVYQRQEFEPTGAALAVFCYSEHAANCVFDHHKSAFRRTLNAVSTFLWCCCLLHCWQPKEPRLGEAVVSVRRAPEPSDFIWAHTSVTGARAAARRLWSWTLTVLVILAGLGAQYGLAMLVEHERRKRVDAQVLDVRDSWDWSFSESGWLATRWLALVAGFTVVLLNWTITLVVRRLSVYERWHTRTSLERWTAVKLTLFYLMNSFAVPILAAYLSSNTDSWQVAISLWGRSAMYSRGGLMESAFWTQAANAVLPPLVNLIDPLDLLYLHILSRFAKTQAMLDWLMSPPDFPLAEQYASAVATLGMGLWYMPVLPISPMIAVLGLFLAYWTDKWVALRRAAHPGNLSGQVTSAAVDPLVRLLPFVQLVLMRFLYFKGYGSMVPVFWTGLALWLLFALAPLRKLLRLIRHTRNTSTGGLSYQETLAQGRRGGLDDAYMPQVPPECSQDFREEATAAFALLPSPLPAIEQPMPHQKPCTAGPATRPPQLRASSALAPGTLRSAASGAKPLDSSYSAGTAREPGPGWLPRSAVEVGGASSGGSFSVNIEIGAGVEPGVPPPLQQMAARAGLGSVGAAAAVPEAGGPLGHGSRRLSAGSQGLPAGPLATAFRASQAGAAAPAASAASPAQHAAVQVGPPSPAQQQLPPPLPLSPAQQQQAAGGAVVASAPPLERDWSRTSVGSAGGASLQGESSRAQLVPQLPAHYSSYSHSEEQAGYSGAQGSWKRPWKP
ncbi:hypothetical protein N2152v2_001168 [Parachlorella kessleri]